MSCNLPIVEGVKDAKDCKCHSAVMRAYGSLIEAGQPQTVALEAARIIYGYHHPEDSLAHQKLTVERWTNEQSLH